MSVMETITRISTPVSDLFFNYSHDEYTRLHNSRQDDESISDDEIKESLRDDAKMFIGCMDSLGVGGFTEDDLIADFMARV